MIPEPATLLAYLAAAVALVLVPGPGTACVLAHSAHGGMRGAVQAALGLETATLLHATAAGLGLSALLAASPIAFDIAKYAGAGYLVVLGVRAWRTPTAVEAQTRAGSAAYRRAVLVGLLNPKAALFFLAFLPQFVDPARGAMPLQFLTLGAMLATIGFGYSLLLGATVSHLRHRLRPSTARWRDRLLGTTFIALGLRLAFQSR